jgi:23S rRNA pseudouridine1911/1915/1917 synthase
MALALDILYEDNHLLAVNKSAGVLVQGDSTGDTPLVDMGKEYISKKYKKPGEAFLGVIHRIDRPVSGVVVFARTSKALERMNALFHNKQTQKTYWAIVFGPLEREADTLIHWLVKDEKKNKTTAYTRETPDGQYAELSYKVIARNSKMFLLEINPITGRPHQIRAQLARAGSPILGDIKYGAPLPLEDLSIALHARRLEFIHPVKKEKLLLQASLPRNRSWDAFAFHANS